MELNIKQPKVKKDLQVGDVVHFVRGGAIYLIIKEDKGYIAKGFDGRSGATGTHETLEDLLKSLAKYDDFTHYSKHEYRLSLEKK